VTHSIGEARAHLEELEREAETAHAAEVPDAAWLDEITDALTETERTSEPAARALIDEHDR